MKQMRKRLYYQHRRGGIVIPAQAAGSRVFVAANDESFSRADAAGALSMKATGWSLAMFVKLTAPSGFQVLAAKDDAASARNFLLYLNGNDLFMFATGGQVTVGTLTTDQKHFIVVWYDPNDTTVHAAIDDGTPATPVTAGAVANTGSFMLGDHESLAFALSAGMEKVVMADRVWTADEQTWLHNAGAGQLYSAFGGAGDGVDMLDDLVAYWPLNEVSGNALDLHGGFDLTDNNTVGSGPAL